MILEAARKLWKKGGESALTMRAVAVAAGTNTPAVYRRFRDRKDILRALVERIRMEFVGSLDGAATPEEAGERYLDFALRHPREYELFFQLEYELFYSHRSGHKGIKPGRPGVDAMKRKLAKKFGGAPANYARLTTSLWMLAHGAAMLLIAKTIPPQDVKQARTIFSASVAALLKTPDL